MEVQSEKEAEAISGTCLKQRFIAVKKYTPSTGSRYRLVVKPDGTQAASRREEAEVFARHFSAAYGGELQPTVNIAVAARCGLPEDVAKARLIPKDPSLVPSEIDLRRAFAASNPAKALGESCLGPELYKCAPVEMAMLHHPLLVKAHLWVRCPISWKGGQVMPLKKLPTASKVSQFRDIRLEDPPAKKHGGLLRKN